MRKILFRGKRADRNEWVYGYLYITHTGKYEISSYNEVYNIERFTRTVIPETVGQYTGLNDKNGAKIFEGDILQRYETKQNMRKYKKPLVVNDIHTLLPEYIDEYYSPFEHFKSEICYEVVGNIHNNPELLKREWGEDNV